MCVKPDMLDSRQIEESKGRSQQIEDYEISDKRRFQIWEYGHGSNLWIGYGK